MVINEKELQQLAFELSRIPLMGDYGRRLDMIGRLPPYFQELIGAHEADARSHMARIARVAVDYPAGGMGLLLAAIVAVERAEASDPEAWQKSSGLTAVEALWSEFAAGERDIGQSPLVGIEPPADQIDVGSIKDADTIAIGRYARSTKNVFPQEEPEPLDLEAALALLAEMGAAGAADTAALPAGSRMPYPRNAQFVGRDARLKQIAAAIKGHGEAGGGDVVLAGMGGIGKTQLAIEFAHRFGRYFAGGVHWLNFDNPALVESEIAACGGAVRGLRPAAFAALDVAQQAAEVLRAWQEPVPRLLIFDNLDRDAQKLYRRWRPSRGGCRVLVTTRRGDWSSLQGLETLLLPLREMTPEESRALLGGLAPHLTEEEMDRIAQKLGHHPLALHVAGSYLAANKESYPAADYLLALDEESLDEESLAQAEEALRLPGGHTPHIYATFALSAMQLDGAKAEDRLAQMALAHAAYFAPGALLPQWLLAASLFEREDAAQVDGDDERAKRKARRGMNKALGRLAGVGLIERMDGDLRLHRLITAFVLLQAERMGGKDDLDIARESVEVAALYAANEQNNASDWAALRSWQEHLLSVTNRAEVREDALAADLCNTAAYFLQQSNADYAAARPYYERALAINEKVLGAEHPDTALSLNNLGGLLDTQGEYEAARPQYERALAIREKVLGAEHPDTAQSLNNLGALLQAQGEYEAARPYYERALAIWEKVLGAEHPDTALSLNNLGALLQGQGEYEAARPYYERALAINEKVLGAEHPDTALSLNNLGALLQAQGEYEAARPQYERALAIREKVLGAEHPDTAVSLWWIGVLAENDGDLDEARTYYQRAYDTFKRALGAEHPNTQNVRGYLRRIETRLTEGNI